MTKGSRGLRVTFEDPLGLIPMAATKLYSLWVSATYPFSSLGQNLSIHYSCLLRRGTAPRIKLGRSVAIKKDTWFNVIDDSIKEVNIIIDDNCSISTRSVISAKNCIHLESDVVLAPSVLIMDHNHAFEDVTRPISLQGTTEGGRIRIGRGTYIGYGAAVICNRGELDIGAHCVVEANSVVTHSVPPYSLVAGNPARIVRQLDPQLGPINASGTSDSIRP